MRRDVEPARSFLLVLGAAFCAGGLYVAWTFDRLVGMGVLLVGAFLLVLPFLAPRSDE